MTDQIETIIANLATLLKKIKHSGGGAYRNDIGDVLDDIVIGDGAKFPLLFISTPKTDFTDLAGNYSEVDEMLCIYAGVKITTKPQAALRTVRADVGQAIETDPTLGGACQRVRILSSANADDLFPGGEGSPPGFDLAKRQAWLRIDCGVTYQAYKPSGI